MIHSIHIAFALILLTLFPHSVFAAEAVTEQPPAVVQQEPTAVPFIPDTAYLDDRARLDALQRDAFLYMWKDAHPVSGMTYEATFGWAVRPVAVGGTGFGIAALVCAVERNWIPREQALERLLRITRFLLNKTPRKDLHGAFPHWLNGETGAAMPFGKNDTGADLVETALLMQGLLIARSYFNGPGAETELRGMITRIWHEIDWNWFTNNEENGLYWHWDATAGFANSLKILGYNECMIVYILAVSSPTHPISRKAYDYWTSGKAYQPKTVYGYRIEGSLPGGGPLFLAHYSFIGLDPRRMADDYVTQGYFIRNVKHTLSNRGYCLYTAPAENRYSERYWGLTASRVKDGYAANEPARDSGTVAPTAALSSLPYTPHYSLQVLEALHDEYKSSIWGPFGPYDALSVRRNWFSTDYLAIDQLPMVCMAENYRSQLLWRLMMNDEEILNGLKIAGIREPELDPGFPEAVLPLKWHSKEYKHDAYDIRRHPDSGHYRVPYWCATAGQTDFSMLDAAGNIVFQKSEKAKKGRNILSFPQFAPTTATPFTLVMKTDDEREYRLPVRLH